VAGRADKIKTDIFCPCKISPTDYNINITNNNEVNMRGSHTLRGCNTKMWTDKQLNLIRDMNKLVKGGLTPDEAERHISSTGWRCDDGKLPNKGDFNKVKARLRMIDARRKGILR
jgi:hypothetical protein